MNNVRWRVALLGAAAFLVAHVVERAMWMSWFADRSMVAWFTNSGRAVAVTMACLAGAAAIGCAGTSDRRERTLRSANVAGGGIVAMIAALSAIESGTIAPVVVIVGGALVIAGAYAGMFVMSLIARATR